MKNNVPVVLGPQPRAAYAAIEKQAKLIGSPVFACHRDWSVECGSHADENFLYSDKFGELKLPKPALAGDHQIINAGLAIAALRFQDRISIKNSAFRAAMGWVRWPGRLQKIDTGLLIRVLPSGVEIWVDGGHNPAAAKMLAAEMRHRGAPEDPLFLVVGMTKSKKLKNFLKPFAGIVDQLYAVPLTGDHEYHPPADIAATANELGFSGRLAKNLESAIDLIARQNSTLPKNILITGSLYLAGEALAISKITPD